jgi:hypothetical protein
MTTRKRVSDRRHHEVVAIEHEGQRFKIGFGREFDRGAVGPIVEVFLNAQKVDSAADLMVADAAILFSMLLQYGCPADIISKSMKRDPNGSAASVIGRAADLLRELSNVQQGGA